MDEQALDGPPGPAATATRRWVLAAGALGVAGLGGCVTRNPEVEATGLADSRVFESLSSVDSVAWGSPRTHVSVSLTPAATTRHGVAALVVIDAGGGEFWSDALATGQTSTTAALPLDQRATLYATTADGTVVDSLRVRVSGVSYP